MAAHLDLELGRVEGGDSNPIGLGCRLVAHKVALDAHLIQLGAQQLGNVHIGSGAKHS